MQIIKAPEGKVPSRFLKSIFLAGPCPRSQDVKDWRVEAVKILEGLGFDGVVFNPTNDHFQDSDYDAQVGWEKSYMDMADLIVFWVPRNMKTNPGLTTNVEFGMYLKSGKVLLGYPENAEKMEYLEHHAKENNVPVFNNLVDILSEAVSKLETASEPRTEGEREVPLFIWRTKHFQSWYAFQKQAGNILKHARVEWQFSPKKQNPFLITLWVDIFIAAENRDKDNEMIFIRPDISSVIGYHGDEFVLIKEFRSPVANQESYVYELPGGSSWKDEPASSTALKEFSEEVGLKIDSSRLMLLGKRQLCSTLFTHHNSVYSVKLTAEELEFLKNQTEPLGVSKDTERTYLEILTLPEILNNPCIDWSMLGSLLFLASQKEG